MAVRSVAEEGVMDPWKSVESVAEEGVMDPWKSVDPWPKKA